MSTFLLKFIEIHLYTGKLQSFRNIFWFNETYLMMYISYFQHLKIEFQIKLRIFLNFVEN